MWCIHIVVLTRPWKKLKLVIIRQKEMSKYYLLLLAVKKPLIELVVSKTFFGFKLDQEVLCYTVLSMQLAHPKVVQPKLVAFRPRVYHWSWDPDGPAKKPVQINTISICSYLSKTVFMYLFDSLSLSIYIYIFVCSYPCIHSNIYLSIYLS